MRSFFSLDDAVRSSSRYRFIVAQECKDKYVRDGVQMERKRRYLGFDDIYVYIGAMTSYPHCHEIMHENYNELMPLGGRLAFDIDVTERYNGVDYVDVTFQRDLRQSIRDVMMTFYNKQWNDNQYNKMFDEDKTIDFVWTTCKNDKKMSKHLIVKGFYFVDDWVQQSKVFYALLADMMAHNSMFWYIKSPIIDRQLIKTNTTLRMPGNSKIGGNVLTFDETRHTFMDGLIKLYEPKQYTKELMISYGDYNMVEMNKLSKVKELISGDTVYASDPLTEGDIGKIMQLFEPYNKGVFVPMNIRGPYVNLRRLRASKCLVSGSCVHEMENSFIFVKDRMVKYSCRRCRGLFNVGALK